MRLTPLPPDHWYASFFFLAGPGALHENVVSAFLRCPVGLAHMFSSLSLRLTPRIYLNVLPYPPYFLALAFPVPLSFLLVQCYTPNLLFSMDGISSWFPPRSFQTFKITLPHHIPAHPLLLSSVQPYQMLLATSFLARSFNFIAISTFSGPYFFKWVYSQFFSCYCIARRIRALYVVGRF